MTHPNTPDDMVIAIIGGSGKLGHSLARRLLHAGFSIVIGSRSNTTAAASAESLAGEIHPEGEHKLHVSGMSNVEACKQATIVILAIPESSYDELLPPLQKACAEKIVLSTAVPFPLREAPPSAGEHAQQLLPQSRIVAGLHTVSNVVLEGTGAVNQDAILVADEPHNVEVLQSVLQAIPGLRAVYGGPLKYSRITESLTHLLIRMNRTYHTAAGIHITGITLPTS